MHLICGEALYDIFVEGEGGSPAELVLRAVAGGSPFNVAIGMARLGAGVALASDIARDMLGQRLHAQLVAEGVDDALLRRAAPASALAIVATDGRGQPSYSFRGLEQATYCPPAEAIDRDAARIAGVHLGSIAMVLPKSAAALLDLVRRFADRALISLDPNVRLSIVPERAAWRRAIDDLRPHVHVVKISDEDVEALYGDADPETICRGLLSGRTVLVVLTRGEKGAVMFGRGAGRVEIPPAPAVVADTVGAGDSFMAALLARLTRPAPLTPAAIAALDAATLLDFGGFAARVAGLTCSRRGPMLPTIAELDPADRGWMDVAR